MSSFFYRSYSQFAQDIRKWLRFVPPIKAVAGIPRSGIIAASIIAMERHIPMISLEELKSVFCGFRPPNARTLPIDSRLPILVIDDTCWNGGSIESSKKVFAGPNILWGAVYINKRVRDKLDLYGYELTTGNHSFEWNIFRDSVTLKLAVDIDGVICDEERWHHYGKQLAPVTRQIHALVTGRPERHRKGTEEWLRSCGIDFRHLYMLPNHHRRETHHQDVPRFKSATFKRLYDQERVVAFVESDPRQSKEIADRTRLPVLCYQTHELHNGVKAIPSWT